MRRALPGVLIAVFLAIAVACGGNDAYVEDNRRLLDSLPVPAAAERVRVTSAAYYEYETDIVDGYTTNAVYEVEVGTTDREIIEFYIGALEDGWEHCREDIPIVETVPSGGTPRPPLGKILLAHFMRSPQMVSINTDGLSSLTYTGTFEVVVDHESRFNPCTGEELR